MKVAYLDIGKALEENFCIQRNLLRLHIQYDTCEKRVKSIIKA